MNKNNLEFDVVSVDQNQNNLESLIVFQIQQISSAVRLTSVGQFIKSSPFELEFPISIGRSKWILFVFLNGQYEAGHANDTISIYLKLIECEHQSAEFKFDAGFQFGSEGTTMIKKNLRLCFANIRTRWFGVNLIKTTEMILNKSRFIRDDVLMLTVSLNELLKDEPTSSPKLFSDYNCSVLSESYLKAENSYTDPPDKSTKPESSAEKTRNSMFREEPYARALYSTPSSTTSSRNSSYNTWHSTYSESKSDIPVASTNRKNQSYNRNIMRDSNMNYVEYSDDEEDKPTGSKKGILESLLSKFFDTKRN